MTGVYNSDRSNDAVTSKSRYSSRNQNSLRNIKERWGTLTSNTCIAGIRKVTNHSARNSTILASSFGRIFWTAWSAVSISETCVAEVLLLCVWHIRQQSRAGTIWKPTGLVSPYLSWSWPGPGSDSVDRQCNSSEVSSGDITGSSPSCGRYCAVGPAVPLLICVWIRAALCTSCTVEHIS